MSKGTSGSSRHLVQTLAASLAHLLNTGRGGTVLLEPFDIYHKITGLLAKPNGPYVRLSGHQQMINRSEAEAAQVYFDSVLDRRMFLARDSHTHKAHDLFLALCTRGTHPSWPRSTLGRSISEVVPIGAPPADFSAVAKNLTAQPTDISPGNPAHSTRAASGPLRLGVPGAVHEVAEELSIWGAIKCAPRQLQPLGDPDAFNEFCSLLIKAVESANAQYGTLVSLGLSPPDWRDLSVNTAKKMSAFMTDVRKTAATQGKAASSLQLWQEIWAERQVPGYGSAAELWNSELGKAVRGQARHWQQDGYDFESAASPDDDREDQMLDRLSLTRMIASAVGDQVIDQIDGEVLTQLMAGVSLDHIAQLTGVAAVLARKKIKINAYVGDIATRIRRHALAMEATKAAPPPRAIPSR